LKSRNSVVKAENRNAPPLPSTPFHFYSATASRKGLAARRRQERWNSSVGFWWGSGSSIFLADKPYGLVGNCENVSGWNAAENGV